MINLRLLPGFALIMTLISPCLSENLTNIDNEVNGVKQ